MVFEPYTSEATYTQIDFPGMPLSMGDTWQEKVFTTNTLFLPDGWYDSYDVEVTGTTTITVPGCGDIDLIIIEKTLTSTTDMNYTGSQPLPAAITEYWCANGDLTVGPLYHSDIRSFGEGFEETQMATGMESCPCSS